MNSQMQTLLFWVGAVVVMILATIFYQPAAAKTGSLLVWTKNRVYVMDIDSLLLRRVGPAAAGERLTPAPGCFGRTETPCWVVVGEWLYDVSPDRSQQASERRLPGAGADWLDAAVSWSPDGLHMAYVVRNESADTSELRLVDATTLAVKIIVPDVDPAVAATWTAACAEGLNVAGCKIGYKKIGTDSSEIAALALAANEETVWPVSAETVEELRWTRERQLLYSPGQRQFYEIGSPSPLTELPPGGQLANVSPQGTYTIYYQPFRLRECVTEAGEECLHLGVWLIRNGEEAAEPALIYNLDLTESRGGGLNFIPVWSADEQSALFFQDGQLLHYDVPTGETTIWYQPVTGKLRSVPIFSPTGEAATFVDNQGQGYSEYRLVVVDPKLQPIEHIIETETGFRLLAWLPW